MVASRAQDLADPSNIFTSHTSDCAPAVRANPQEPKCKL